ncbi:MAG: hypothetical protein OWS74_02000 [Firmicutes bacterium]|nr:hypothetical protein [Bacillota bacterium]
MNTAEEWFSYAEWTALCHASQKYAHFELESYHRAQMERRIRLVMQQLSLPSVDALIEALRSSPPMVRRYTESLIMHVSQFFRNPESWQTLAQILTDAQEEERNASVFSAWSVGCSYGQEAISLSILLQKIFSSYRVIATDRDASAIQEARTGLYVLKDLPHPLPVMLEQALTFFAEAALVKNAVMQPVIYTVHDILRQPPPDRFDLIVCRNVMIYFSAATREKILQYLIDALYPGGWIFLGATEAILNCRDLNLRYIGSAIYQKIPQKFL